MSETPYEPEAVSGRLVVAIAAGILAVTVAGVGIAALLLDWSAGSLTNADVEDTRSPPPTDFGLVEATLFGQERPAQVRRAAGAALDEYRWVDREAGVVTIPVDVAIELYLERRGGTR